MKRRLFALAVLIATLFPLALAGSRFEQPVTLILIYSCWAALAAASVYKIVLLVRYRNDPAKRDAVASSQWPFPGWLRRFVTGEPLRRR